MCKKIILFSIAILSFYFICNAWEDEVLFTSGSYSYLKPNVMILLDNSGSMNHIICHPDYNPNYTYSGTSSWIYIDEVEGTTTRFINGHDVLLYKYKEGSGVRYSPNYLNWIGGWDAPPIGASDTQRAEVSHFSQYGTFDTTDFTEYEDTRTRIQVARRVMTEVVYDIFEEYENDPNPDAAYPRIGLSLFEDDVYDPLGADKIHNCEQSSDPVSFANIIKSILATSWTPLSESYAEIWAYFRHGGTPKLDGPGSTYFVPFTDPSVGTISSSPITNWCQLNFIIVVTDGESTKDLYLRSLPNTTLFYTGYFDGTTWVHDLSAPWGDPPDGEHDDDKATYDPGYNNGTYYLDDVAYFAFNNDLYPDDAEIIKTASLFETVYKNKQFIYTYAIGFAYDNQILQDTAENGGGEYLTADDYESLLQAMKDVFASINEKVRAYASFSAPKYSLTYEERHGYAATFVPKNNQNIWEGHLKCYLLDENGDFPADLENPGSALLWDAGMVLSNRTTDRDIWTYVGGTPIGFNTTSITPAMLGFNSGDTTLDAADRDKVVDFIRGNNTYNWKLGDIFHFSPLVVGVPLPWKGSFDPSYQDFFEYYTKTGAHASDGKARTEVVYVGSNDGMFHCFSVETGEELWGFIPPSMLTKLKHPVPGVTGSLNQHTYFIDGKGSVKDIRVAYNNDYTDWKTVLIFGMGMGGKSYCALDVTDPDYPLFLWEFNDATTMGYTEGRPIIADVGNDGTGTRFPGVFLSGGHDKEELPAPGDLEGKSFFILKAYTGALVKKFIYGNTTSDPDNPASLHTNSGFKYAFAATPTVIDLNYDGLADYVYMLETGDYLGSAGNGGRIWKVNVNGVPLGWRPTKIFQAEDGQTLFLPPTIGLDQSFNLWVLFGTGHRSQPNNIDNLTGQFFGILDDSAISSPITTANLSDITASFTTPGTDATVPLGTYKGFYFDYVNKEGEMLFEPNPLFINYTVYFNTYAPSFITKKEDPCGTVGNQWVYSFKLTGGAGLSITGTNVESGKIQGYGALAGGKYKLYIGTGEAGSPDIQKQETIDLTDIFGPIYWKEDRK